MFRIQEHPARKRRKFGHCHCALHARYRRRANSDIASSGSGLTPVKVRQAAKNQVACQDGKAVRMSAPMSG